MEHVGRLLEKPECPTCEAIHERRGSVPPCEECLPPLMEENREAVMIYQLCQNQLLMTPMGGPVDLDHKSIHEAMRLYAVRDRRGCFERVLRIFRLVQSKRLEAKG